MRFPVALLVFALMLPILSISALPKVGSEAPAVRAVSYDGKALSTTSLRGKVVVLMFVAEWCPHCREELPALSTAWREYELEREGIIGIVMMVSSGESRALEFFNSVNPPSNWKLVLAGEDTARDFGVSGVPTTVVIDGNWTVAGVFVGAQPPDKVLEPVVRLSGQLTSTTQISQTEESSLNSGLPIAVALVTVLVLSGLYYYARRYRRRK
ncbi:MAG: TlpA disulfide reductase family protein [Candidatus Korarchaeum sp.]